MSSDERFFYNLDKSKTANIKLANGTLVKRHDIEDIQMNTSTCIKKISKVILVYDLIENLISVSKLIGENYTLIFLKDHIWSC